MGLSYKSEFKVWAVYFITVFVACFIHELGHCTVAWIHGLKAIPTPAKEYLLSSASPATENYISLGGIIGTVSISVLLIIIFIRRNFKFNSPLFAASLASPGIYSLMFLIKGRGHDGTEFQEAQSALGLSYSGHSLDWFFLVFFLGGIFIWIIHSKPTIKFIPRLLLGSILTFIFIIGLQEINNAIFDPVLLAK